MCQKTDCNHTHDVTITDRDRRIAQAFYATMSLCTVMTNRPDEIGDDMLANSNCGANCDDASCPRRALMDDALAQAINHVDHGEPLPAYLTLETIHGTQEEELSGFIVVSVDPPILRAVHTPPATPRAAVPRTIEGPGPVVIDLATDLNLH